MPFIDRNSREVNIMYRRIFTCGPNTKHRSWTANDPVECVGELHPRDPDDHYTPTKAF